MTDWTRKFDLEELASARRNANSQAEREHYERIADRIIRESAPIKSLREKLMLAVRANDVRAVKRIEAHIHAIRLDETNGKSWGNNKGNRKVAS